MIKSAFRLLHPALVYSCLGVLLVLGPGCTTVPSKEFATYKDTFNQARAAGEQVLLDHGAAASQYGDLRAKRDTVSSKPKARGDAFDPLTVAKQTARVDHIAVRMKAWDVVARYNDLLTALAEGKSADDLAAAVDGLSNSLGTFPIAEVALSWTQVSGYLAPLKPLALEAVREQSRRKFVAAVAQGGPLITDKFIKLLKEDTTDFYTVRSGLNDLEYQPMVDRINKVGIRFATVAEQFQPTPEIASALNGLNREVSSLPPISLDSGPSSPALKPVELRSADAGAPALTPEALVQLKSLQADAAALVAQALAKDAELDAYRQVLTHYVEMLDQLDQSMRALQLAAEQAQPAFPQGADLERTVILLREAYIKYKDM
jgi:hypothetical protein